MAFHADRHVHILIIGGGALALVLIIGVAIVTMNRPTTTTTTTGSSAPSAPVAANTPTGAVQAYFDALAANNASGVLALSYDDSYADPTFITSEVMAAASAAAPITGLSLSETPVSNYSARVTATYTIGGVSARSEFSVGKRDDVWLLMRPAASVYVSEINDSLLGVTINGVTVPDDDDSVNLLPGGYTLATTSKVFTFKDTSFTVKSPDATVTPKFDLALTDDGLDSYRKAVKSLVNSCKKPKGLVDSKCGLNLRAPSGVTIKASNMSCSPSSSSICMRPTPAAATPRACAGCCW